MTTVTISVEGLSLWIRRKEHWDVLFPKAVGSNQQHRPYLTIDTHGKAVDPVRQTLQDFTLTTKGLTAGAAPDSQVPPWMLKVRARASSAAGSANPALSRDVFASLRLPLQVLERKSARNIGPVSFNGESYQLDYGTSIRLNAAGAASLELNDKGTFSGGAPINLDTSVSNIFVTIENLTDKDQAPDCGETKSGEHLEETDDLLALCDMQVAVPRYFGPDLKKVCTMANIVRGAGYENPYRLCPSAYCIDCPDN